MHKFYATLQATRRIMIEWRFTDLALYSSV
jgi:hypothetical protein